MATKLYPRLGIRTSSEGFSKGFETALGFWDSATFNGNMLGDHIETAKGAALNSNTKATVTGPASIAYGTWTTYPVSAAFTLSGTITLNTWQAESAVGANAGSIVAVRKVEPDGTNTLVVEQARGVEMAVTTRAVQNWTATGYSAVDFEIGDRIQFWWGATDAGGTMASANTISFSAEGTTDGADGDTWFQLAEDVTFDTSNPAGSSFYFRDTTSDITDQGAGVNEKELNLGTRGASAVSAVTNTVTGPITAFSEQVTTTAGGNDIEWYSPRLTGSIEGKCYIKVRGLTSNAASWASLAIEIARVEADGSGAVVIGRSIVGTFSLGTGAAPLDTSEATRECRIGIHPIDLAGQRLRVRMFNQDIAVGPSDNNQATGFTATFRYDGASAGNGDSFITFAQTIDEFAPFLEKKPKRIVGPQHLGAVAGTTIYTVPDSAACWVRHIHVINPTGSQRTVTLSIGPDGAGTRVFDTRPIAANGMIEERRAAEHWLNAGEVVQANADAASSCVIVIDAIEYSQI